jgi:hypothetical protein
VGDLSNQKQACHKQTTWRRRERDRTVVSVASGSVRTLLTPIHTISSHSDGMVHLGPTSTGDDTTAVKLKHALVPLMVCGHWLPRNCHLSTTSAQNKENKEERGVRQVGWGWGSGDGKMAKWQNGRAGKWQHVCVPSVQWHHWVACVCTFSAVALLGGRST